MFLKRAAVIIAFLSYISGDPCENVVCPNVPKHYRELECTPLKSENDCCVKSYECRDFKSLDRNKCHFKGQEYEVGTAAPDEITGECETYCICQPGYPTGRPAYFDCADIECQDLFDDSLYNCVRQYKSGECCPDYKCTEAETINLGFCVLDGRTYRTGEIMYPNSLPCHTCRCSDSFDNSTLIGNTACTEVNCQFEFRDIQNFQKGCVPIYFKTDSCCAIEYRCPNQNDVVVKSKDVETENDSKMQCKFGELTLNVGDTIETNDICLTCSCSTPPFMHCIKAPKCYGGKFV